MVAVSPAARSGRRATVEPRTIAGASSALVRGVGDGALQVAVLEPQVGLDERDLDRCLRPHRPQGAEPDGEVADLRRLALQDVERRAGRVAAERVADDRRRTAGRRSGTRSWYVPRVGEKTPT